MPDDQISTSNPEAPAGEQAAPEAAPQEETAPEATSTTEGQAKGTGGQEEAFFDQRGVPPELEPAYKQMQAAFTKKTQGIAETKKKAGYFDQLAAYQPFRQWYEAQRNPAPEKEPAKPAEPAPVELTEEQHQELLSSPSKMAAFIREEARRQVEAVAMPQTREAVKEVAILKKQGEIDDFAAQHPDFWKLDDAGRIEPLLRRYPGMGIEDIYKLAKYPDLEAEAVAKAHKLVEQKKGAVSEKPGLQGRSGQQPVKVKNREEAMRLSWEEAKAGRALPDFEIEARR